MAKRERKKVVYATTVGSSAHSLLRGQLAWLKENDWQVVLCTTPDVEARLAAGREQVLLKGISMKRGIAPLSDAVSLTRWIYFLMRFRPDVINVGTPKAGLLGGIAGWVTRVPKRVYLVRGLRLEGSRPPLSWVLWLMERLAIAVATDVVVVSLSLGREMLGRRLIPRGKGWLIGAGSSNGIDANAIARRVSEVDRGELRCAIGIPHDAFVIGFIGRITPDKGLQTLLSAFGRTRSRLLHLLIVGDVEHETLANLIDLLGPRVHRLPWTDDVWGILSAVDVLSLPSRREGFPTVVLEAAAAGVPAITTRVTGAVDSVEDGKTGLLHDVDDVDSLAKTIEHLASSPNLVGELGRAAMHRARTEFRQETVWSGMASIMEGLPSAEVTELESLVARTDSNVGSGTHHFWTDGNP